ncbi:LysR substrate-binding domain-containing protein [Acidithiobacillus ferrivorans]|uniref:LysR substrate-binding domain-containing protein n=1 Tax=Acidithiobacillus ferrivorans TaxID=160808 RepID=UPI000AA7AB55|nr:LysR substrate-binding domain-containing protein [Acidithiobacillus ferrivorans]
MISTTRTQARYTLPGAVKKFTGRCYPNAQLRLRQGNPTQIAELLASGDADMAIATEALNVHAGLVAIPCYQWNRVVIAPLGHYLLKSQRLTLEAIADYPIITYDQAVAGRSLIDKTFSYHRLSPNIVLSAIDPDVIKAYVELGLGIGIVASMAYDSTRDSSLGMLDASHFFEPSITYLALRKETYLRQYLTAFIELYAPHLDCTLANSALDMTRISKDASRLPTHESSCNVAVKGFR